MDILAKVTGLENSESALKALATITLNDRFAIHGIKIVESTRTGEPELFVQMPSWVAISATGDKSYQDLCYPISAECRAQIIEAVMEQYRNPRESEPREQNSEPLEISVSLKKGNENSNIKAYGQIVLGDEFVVGGVKVIESEKGPFVQMPAYQTADGDWKDIAHPITAEERERVILEVMKKYHIITNAEYFGKSFAELGGSNEVVYYKCSDKFAEKLEAALTAAGIEWGGRKLDGKTTLIVNMKDDADVREIKAELRKRIRGKDKDGDGIPDRIDSSFDPPNDEIGRKRDEEERRRQNQAMTR